MIRIAFTILLFLASSAFSGEVQEVAKLAKKYGGQTEYRLPDGTRVDLLTKTHAIEADWAKKYHEAIGQALEYGLATNRLPGIILLVKDPEREERYVARCRKVCERYGIELWTEPVPKPDKRTSRLRGGR